MLLQMLQTFDRLQLLHRPILKWLESVWEKEVGYKGYRMQCVENVECNSTHEVLSLMAYWPPRTLKV